MEGRILGILTAIYTDLRGLPEPEKGVVRINNSLTSCAMAWSFGKLSFCLSILLLAFGFGWLAYTSFAEGLVARPVYQAAAKTPLAGEQAQCGPDLVAAAAPLAPPPPPTPAEALKRGVLIVVSIPSQKLFVFKNGSEWGSTSISTGRAGHGTPVGVFPILQKQARHRSTIYSGAPMPYMQRLTWGGVALHAGHVTGYPASHGCIRLPWDFARRLYTLTNPALTSVLIVRQPLQYAEQAMGAAGAGPMQAAPVRQAQAALVPVPVAGLPVDHQKASEPAGPVQTIQLAATPDPRGADWLWHQLSQTEPELKGLSPAIVPAMVRASQVFRLRASGQDAHAICSRLVAHGVACLKVVT